MGKDHKKSRREEREHGSKERDREHPRSSDASKEKELHKDSEKDRRVTSRDRWEDIEDHEKDKHREKARDKDYDYDQRDRYREKEREREKDHKDRGKDKERERGREPEKEHHDRGRERKEKDKDRERERDRAKDREGDKHKDRDREKEKEKNKDRNKPDREKGKGRDREREREMDGDDKERLKDKENDKLSVKNRDDGKGSRDHERESSAMENKQNHEMASGGPKQSTTELQQRIQKLKEERLKEKSEGVSEVLSWVSKSRKLEEKRNAEKEKALHKSKVFEEQDNNVLGESEDEEPIKHTASDLAGVKVLHGLDKVIEGGAVVLTLKDQNILADGDINEEVDMLENVEIGQQKQRDEAYKAAKKKPGTYDDKFNDEASGEKKMLPQYDDPMENEGVTLDASGRFTGAAEKKLEELRKRIQGVSTKSVFEDLTSSAKVSSDYFTQDEMLQFKKPKKKKSLRKKDKLDLDALEAEAISTGLGVGDLGSRKDGKRQIAKEEQQRSEAQMRSDAYQSAYAKAEEASKALRQELSSTTQVDEDETVFGDEDDDFYKALEKSRRLALKKQGDGAISGLQAVASLALSAGNRSEETQNPSSGETQENKVVFTEMEEFVGGLQLNNEDTHKPQSEDIYMDEDETLNSSDQETKDEPAGWTEVNDISNDEVPTHEDTETVPDETLHEVAVGKGLSGALKLLKERGTLKETIEWGGRNMDKKKSKLVGIHENDGPKEIHIERLDEFGRVMTPKEAFRLISHKFHGKGPGKTKLEKRQKQYQEEQKLKQMKNSDTPSQSVEKMRAAQAYTGKPYLVLTGNVKSGQNSDLRSGFSTVEDLPGGLTPMLGDRKVEHFLGIKRKAEPSNMGPPKKQKPN